MKYPNGKRSQIMIVTTCLEMDLKTLFKIIRARRNLGEYNFKIWLQ